MSDIIKIEIPIPLDDDGYALLQCSYCESLFKITATDCENDDLLHIWCPCCGLISENYLTEEVIELVMVKSRNAVTDYIYNGFKHIEMKNNSKNAIEYETGEKPIHEYENPLYIRIDELTLYHYKCCKKNAKISPLKKMSASFCPFCGVIDFGNE